MHITIDGAKDPDAIYMANPILWDQLEVAIDAGIKIVKHYYFLYGKPFELFDYDGSDVTTVAKYVKANDLHWKPRDNNPEWIKRLFAKTSEVDSW